jgi:twitching motility protein PilT
MGQNESIEDLLYEMVKAKASDLYIKAGSPPVMRVGGKLTGIDNERWKERSLTPLETEALAYSLMGERQRKKFEQEMEADLAYSASGLGRFRVNIFRQRNSVAMVLRLVPFTIPPFETLNLPEVIIELAETERGIVLATGATGSGKSTTLAAMIDHINRTRRAHIVTIEDPIEFLHRDNLSIINQREVEMDTLSFADALRHVVRQNPDVIMIGEMRDLASLQAAMSAAETGHFVLTTMHTIDATQTIERIINFFPPHQHNHIRLQLALCLRAIISLRLLPRCDVEGGRIPACEILIVTPLIKKLIEENKISQIPSAIAGGGFYGMQTFNQSLVSLYQRQMITYEEALNASTNPEEFKLNVRGIYSGKEVSMEEFITKETEDEKVAKIGGKQVMGERHHKAQPAKKEGVGSKKSRSAILKAADQYRDKNF